VNILFYLYIRVPLILIFVVCIGIILKNDIFRIMWPRIIYFLFWFKIQ